MHKLLLIIGTLLLPLTAFSSDDDTPRWGDIDYKGAPWVRNISEPLDISNGLQGRHLSLWASHGYYYDQKESAWRWQRPKLFATTEDLFTQTIVVPYLIPMLENAGAIVFTPRERDWQKEEIIVDNDGSKRNYIEVTSKAKWQTSPVPGFLLHEGTYADGENPFLAGSARMVKTTSSKTRYSLATYQPDFKKAGRYAVYVSYTTLPNSIDDAVYTVWHRGERTEFKVNQQMGGSTWVYLGTFDFDAGYSEFNRVTVSNQSGNSGVVTTDAVRFGGGMGNIQRFGLVSGMPRALEGARYYAQWAGMPYEVYSSKNGQDDYADDINARSLMTNLLGGGSCYMPNKEGRKVPIELSLAIHSDAGYAPDATSIYGSLAICTTNHNEGLLDAGISRQASYKLAEALLNNETKDLTYQYGKWAQRDLYNRNYSETRLPEVPSSILETLSHQSFPDMRYGQDPNFRFTLARSVYKTLLRYINGMHDKPYVVTPLAPDNIRCEFTHHNKIRLSWNAVTDPQEPSSVPSGYIVYTAMGEADFDNGTYVHRNHFSMELEPNLLYHFKVVACNSGGKSFPTEVLSALYNPRAEHTVLVVNGFHRLSSPAVRENGLHQGFDLDDDPGITYGPTFGFVGRQINFDRTQMGIEKGGLGDSSDELAGKLIAGNDFNYVATHAKAIQTSGRYNIVSCASEAVDNGHLSLQHYDAVDLILGLERTDGHSVKSYKTFRPAMQQALRGYMQQGGHLLVSGAYVGSDMLTNAEQQFMSSVLHCQYGGRSQASTNQVLGLGTQIYYYQNLNEEHYAATSTDILHPVRPAITSMQYADGYGAATAYKDDHCSVFVMGFPFECIKTSQKRSSIMNGILNYLIK